MMLRLLTTRVAKSSFRLAQNPFMPKYETKKLLPLVSVNMGNVRYASTDLDGDIDLQPDLEQQQSFFTGVWQMLSNSTPVAYVQDALVEIHDYTGLPWYASIILSTILLRTIVTLPLTIYQYKISARLELIALEMPAIVEELKKEAAMAMRKFQWTENQTQIMYRRSLKQQWNKLVIRENCHPAKTLIVLWGQIPLWICQSVALRNLVYILPDQTSFKGLITYTELTLGGFGWIPNLTEVDSSYILPVALGLINLGIVEMQSALRILPPTRLQRYATNTFRALNVLMIPVACTVPSALCLYWVTSSAYGLAQNLLLISPRIRRAIGIPKTKSERLNPYQHLWDTIKIRTGQMKSPEKVITPSMKITKPNQQTSSSSSSSSSSTTAK